MSLTASAASATEAIALITGYNFWAITVLNFVAADVAFALITAGDNVSGLIYHTVTKRGA